MSTKMKSIFAMIACLAMLSAASAQVMINEFLYDTVGDDSPDLMYTEIYGPPGTSLDDWSLVGINGNGGAVYRTVNLSGEIPADGYFVVGNTASVTNVDLVVGGAMGAGVDWQNAGSSSGDDCDGIQLLNSGGTVVDAICYGPCAAGHVCSGEGDNAPDPYPSGGVNSSLARIPDHSDTDDNATDFQPTEDLTPGAPNEGEPCVPVNATLAEIRDNDANGVATMLGTFVITEGIVSIENGLIQAAGLTSFFFQDDDAGANIFGGSVPAGIVVGDCLRVSGWVDQFRGMTELAGNGPGNCIWNVTVIGHTDPPVPIVLQGNSFFESFEGMLVKFEGLTITGGDSWPTDGNDADINVTDGTGTFVMRIDKETAIDGTTAPTEPFDLVGIMTQYDFDAPYDNNYQVLPRYRSDIIDGGAADDPADNTMPVEFRLNGAYPNPFNSTTNLRFAVGNASELTVHVFDLLGREVAVEKLTGLTPGNHVWNWTPTGATGLYIVRMESQNVVESAKVLYLK